MNALANVADRLISAYPPYSDEWHAVRQREDFDTDLPYSHVGDMAKFMVDRLKTGQQDGIDELFAEFESLLDEQGARNLLIVGFLEDLQNLSLNRGVELDRWAPWFGPKTRAAWEAVQKLWTGATQAEEFNAFVDGGILPGGGAV